MEILHLKDLGDTELNNYVLKTYPSIDPHSTPPPPPPPPRIIKHISVRLSHRVL